MMKVLRNLNINTMVAGALVCCALLVSVLAVLRFTTNEMVEANVVILVMTIIFYVYGFADKYFSGKGCQSLISRL